MNIAIIGSNRGIGLALTKLYAQNAQNKIYAFCRQASPELSALEVEVIEGCDVGNADSLKDSAQKVKDLNFDLFIHVSGILYRESYEDINAKTIQEQLLINSLAPIQCVKAFDKNLGKGSKLGLVTSRMGSIQDNDSGGMYGYRMSKAALNAGGKSLALDLKDRGISVFLLHPGYVKTDMTGGKGNMTPEESAEGITNVLAKHDLSDSGTFWHANGEELPW